MKAFHFNLERVLEWQASQLLAEEAELRRVRKELSDLDAAARQLEQNRIHAENELRNETRLDGSDLMALDAYRRHTQKQEESLRVRRIEIGKRVQAQLERLLVARRKHRLLEKLRERRHGEWLMASDREIEQLASETYLAKFNREDF